MKFINLHTHTYTNSNEILEIVNQYPLEFIEKTNSYSIGIHPWKIDINTKETELSIIKKKLQETNCIALGECGLDKRIDTNLNTQIEVFELQLELVKTTFKPIILHLVAAFDELISIKKNMNITNTKIVHGFSKNYQIASQLLNQGLYLSFGKNLLRNKDLSDVFRKIPNEKIFLETDTITESLEEVYTFAANCKNISVEEMKEIVWNNYITVFGK